MKTRKKEMAMDMFISGGLTKTQIANMLNVDRRTIYLWAHEGKWGHMKLTAAHMPSLIAEHCYFLISGLTTGLLDNGTTVTGKDAEIIYKLVASINKLKGRSTVNENMELLTYFLEHVKGKDEDMAQAMLPFIQDYLVQRKRVRITKIQTPDTSACRVKPMSQQESLEDHLDDEAFDYWENKLNKNTPQNPEQQNNYPEDRQYQAA